MKITNKDQAIHTTKPEGVEVWYYLFPEYEIHYNEQRPHTTQAWHFHEKIHESIFVIEGQLEAKWKEGEQEKSQILNAGDLAETQNSDHTFENKTDQIVKFLVLKQVLSGEDRSVVLKNDKVNTHV